MGRNQYLELGWRDSSTIWRRGDGEESQSWSSADGLARSGKERKEEEKERTSQKISNNPKNIEVGKKCRRRSQGDRAVATATAAGMTLRLSLFYNILLFERQKKCFLLEYQKLPKLRDIHNL